MWPIGKCLLFSKILLTQFPEGYEEFLCVCVVHYWSSWLNILPLPQCSLLNQAIIKVKNTKKRERALQIQYYFKYYYNCFRSLLICSISSQYLNQRISSKQLQFLLQTGKKKSNMETDHYFCVTLYPSWFINNIESYICHIPPWKTVTETGKRSHLRPHSNVAAQPKSECSIQMLNYW